jgi:RNA recognition motif-containing protein
MNIYVGNMNFSFSDQELSNLFTPFGEVSSAKIILDNRILIDLAVEKLLEVETLDGEDFKKLIQQYTISAIKSTSEPIVSNN